MKSTSFIIALLGLLLVAGLGAWQHTDVSGSLVALVTAYLTAQATRKASHVWAASKDASASTADAISAVERTGP